MVDVIQVSKAITTSNKMNLHTTLQTVKAYLKFEEVTLEMVVFI